MKSYYILTVLSCLAIVSYISYIVTFRLFDSNGDGSLTSEEIEQGYNKILDPDKTAKQELIEENIQLKRKVDELEKKLEKLQNSCKENTNSLFTIIENNVDNNVKSPTKQKKKSDNIGDIFNPTNAFMLGQEAIIIPPIIANKGDKKSKKKKLKLSNTTR